MPAKKSARPTAAKNFTAALERLNNPLRWIIARVPIDVHKVWGTRGQLKVTGTINGFDFRTAIFPTKRGEHFLIVNKKMQSGGKTATGLTAKFCLQPDTTPRPVTPPAKELLHELGQSRRLLKYYHSLNPSRQREITKWIAGVKSEEARQRRSRQIAERLMETLEAERELPPIMQLAFRQNPRAREKWESMSAAHRRSHLFSIFYYRNPEARARRIAKCVEDLLGFRKKASGKEDFGESPGRNEELE
jgi:hypothetical protein